MSGKLAASGRATAMIRKATLSNYESMRPDLCYESKPTAGCGVSGAHYHLSFFRSISTEQR